MITVFEKPVKYSTIYSPVIYKLSKTGTDKETVIVLNGTEIIGQKQFTRAGEIQVNVAEYYKSCIRAAPIMDDSLSFIHAENRTITANINAGIDCAVLLTSGINDPVRATLLSSAPSPRLLNKGESDELSYLVDEGVLAGEIRITIKGGEVISIPIPNSNIDGVASLVVNYDSIAELLRTRSKRPEDMETIEVRPTLACFDLPSVLYRVNHSAFGVRMAWWNRQGGIDYYTFAAAQDKGYSVERQKVKTSKGWTTVSSEVSEERKAVSEALPRASMEWLAEIVSSPLVWLIEEGEAIPVDITSESITVWDRNALSSPSLSFRSIDTEKMQKI